MKFRDNLLHLRQQRNMTQEQLAMLLGGMAAHDAGSPAATVLGRYFWVAWPIDGIACAITSLAMRAAAEK